MRDWLKKVRTEKGLTLKNVSKAAGISECYYSQIENGRRNASPYVAKKIATVLGIQWEKFFELTQERHASKKR